MDNHSLKPFANCFFCENIQTPKKNLINNAMTSFVCTPRKILVGRSKDEHVWGSSNYENFLVFLLMSAENFHCFICKTILLIERTRQVCLVHCNFIEFLRSKPANNEYTCQYWSKTAIFGQIYVIIK